MYHNMKIHITS